MKKLLVSLFMMAASLMMWAQTSPISVRWEMGTNGAEKGKYSSRFIFKNISGKTLENNWQFYFNQFNRKVTLPENSKVDIKNVSTTYYQVTPNSNYKALAPGDSLVVDLLMRGTYVNICYSPMGGHVVMNGDTNHPLTATIEVGQLEKPGQWSDRPNDYPDGNRMYAFNATLKNGKKPTSCYDIFPTPKEVKLAKGYTTIGNVVTINGSFIDLKHKAAKKLLKECLQARNIYVSDGQKTKVTFVENKKLNSNPEYYEMKVSNGNITITAADPQGIMNGVKTLVAAIDHAKNGRIENATIKDVPDFNYRGFMMDIARNFTTFENFKKIIDILSYYKFNRIQFHFTDDEAWRVEIPGLPELTEVGARRGCTLDEKEYLAEIFDGNGNPNDLSTSANGYYTRAQFIELLKYAEAHGIKMIPEIETPGHARAAIVAMKARYNKYIGYNKELAEQYMMWDDADTSKYSSAQDYHDDVLNVAREGVYNFIYKVVDELQKMYAEAGQRLDIVHLGGDEVASGSWVGSPVMQAFMKEKGLKTTHEASEYYINRVSEYLATRHIQIEGWQEVALKHSKEYNAKVTPRFAGVNAWSTVGSRCVVPYEMANDGYPVILSNVTNFYIDMAYNWHQYEKGLHWGGVVDEYSSWYAQPLDIYKTARYSIGDGSDIDLKKAGEGRLKLEKPENIIGVQGQLWGETIRDFKQVQHYMLPKIFGLAERGWNAKVEWNDSVAGSFEKARAAYNTKVAAELPVLNREGYNFRLGLPGVVVEKGVMKINTQYPGEVVRYTLDGSEPSSSSPIYTAPVKLKSTPKLIKAKAYYLGKESLSTYLWP